MDTYDIYLKHEAGNVLPVEEAIEIYTSLVQSVALSLDKIVVWRILGDEDYKVLGLYLASR